MRTFTQRAVLTRGVFFLMFWLVLIGASLGNLLLGLLVAATATWISLQLLPPSQRLWHYAALFKLAGRFVQESALGGIDVARRAFAPRLRLSPGFIAYPLRLPSAAARNTFSAFTSVLPGTLPAGRAAQGALIYHCLDVEQPIMEQLDIDQALLHDALGETYEHP